jgi:uncharacterized membrane protein
MRVPRSLTQDNQKELHEMTLDPLLNAPFVIQLHALSAIAAGLIGPFAIWRKTRALWHRLAGALWIVLMLTVATSALFIHTIQLIGPFSPIHLLSGLVYYSLFVAIRHVRAGRYLAHGLAMRSLYLQSLGIAGLFALSPGRIMHNIFFGDNMPMGLAVMAILAVGLVILLRSKPRLQFLR